MTRAVWQVPVPGATLELGEAQAKAARTYDAAADSFDAPPLGFWARHGAATIARLSLPEGAEVLDVACGSGASALPAAEAVGPRGRVLGIDLSSELLGLARRKAAARGLRNTTFRRADMTGSGFPDRSFDAVVCVFGVFFVTDMAGLVAELWRLVRPGGQLAVTTWGPDLFAPASRHWWRAVARERPDLVAAFNPWDRIVAPESVRRLLEDGGVTDPRVTACDDAQPVERPEDWWTMVMGSGLRWTVEEMGPAAAARVRAANLRMIGELGITAVRTDAIYASAIKPQREVIGAPADPGPA